jgi:hypothetical protein
MVLEPVMAVHAEPMFELVFPESNRQLAEAESLDAILLAAATIRSDGEDLSGVVVMKAGRYDPATTALIAEGLV